MRMRQVGSSGLRVAEIGLGTAMWGNSIAPEVAGDLLDIYLDAGGNFLDTAHTYGRSEEAIGELLNDRFDRDDLVIATKAGISGDAVNGRVLDASRGSLMRQLDTSLLALRTDHVDLWMIHRFDPDVPVAEMVSALVWAHQSGRARYVGVSNHNAWQAALVASLLEREGVPMVCVEAPWSLLDRRVEGELTQASAALGFGLIAYSPLARGILTGKYRSGIPTGSRAAGDERVREQLTERTRAVVEAVATAAQGLQSTPTHVALAWVLGQERLVSAISGARSTQQLGAVLGAVELTLPEEIRSALSDVAG